MWRPLLVVLAVAAAAFSCSYESDTDAGADPTVVLSTTTIPAPPEGAAPTTKAPATTTPAAACPGGDPAIPAGARNFSEAVGDFDGNGGPDLLQVFSTSGRDPWRLRVLLTGSGVLETTLREPSHLGEQARAVGGFDVGGDDGDEIFAVIGRDGSFHRVGVFVLEDCQIRTVTGDDGSPVGFAVGDTFRERRGLECKEDGLVERRADSRDGRTFSTEEGRYELEGSALEETSRERGGTLTRPAGDFYLDVFGSFVCGTLGLGPPP